MAKSATFALAILTLLTLAAAGTPDDGACSSAAFSRGCPRPTPAAAGAAASGTPAEAAAAFRTGMYLLTRPRRSTTVVVSGSSYVYSGGVYYVQSGSTYVVTAPPTGAVVYAVPSTTTVVYSGTTPYLYYDGAYYVKTDKPAPAPDDPDQQAQAQPAQEQPQAVAAAANDPNAITEPAEMPEMVAGDDHNYEVVAPPVGATVPYLPDGATEKTVGGKKYFVQDGTYYRPFASDGETIYMVTANPEAGG